jgi:hypothetical protein
MLFLKKLVDDHLHAPEIEVAKKVRIILLCFDHSQYTELLFRVRVCAVSETKCSRDCAPAVYPKLHSRDGW